MGDPRDDPYGITVSASRFVAHLEIVRRCAKVVDLPDVLTPGPERRVAITFDDGYASMAHTAVPLVVAHGMPATVFVASSLVGTTNPLWTDRLVATLFASRPRRAVVRVASSQLELDLRTRVGIRTAVYSCRELLLRGTPAAADAEVAALATQLEVADPAVTTRTHDQQFMTEDQLRHLAQMPGITIGGHTRNHAWLGGTPVDAQRDEIMGGRHDLELIIGTPVTRFAYPYGSPDCFDDATLAVLTDTNFDLACVATPPTPGEPSDRWRIPRHHVANFRAEDFERVLLDWLAAR